MVGTAAVKDLPDLAGGLQGHQTPDVIDGRAEVRSEQGAGVAQQAVGDGWRVAGQHPVFHRKHVGGVTPQVAAVQRVGDRVLIDNRASPDVDHERAGARAPD